MGVNNNMQLKQINIEMQQFHSRYCSSLLSKGELRQIDKQRSGKNTYFVLNCRVFAIVRVPACKIYSQTIANQKVDVMRKDIHSSNFTVTRIQHVSTWVVNCRMYYTSWETWLHFSGYMHTVGGRCCTTNHGHAKLAHEVYTASCEFNGPSSQT